MYSNKQSAARQQNTRRVATAPPSSEKSKPLPRPPSIDSLRSSIDEPPKAHVKLPKATPPPYYSSANKKANSLPYRDASRLEAAVDRSLGGGVKQRRPPSFYRRHWFVITVCIFVTITSALAVTGVMLQRQKNTAVVFEPSPEVTQSA